MTRERKSAEQAKASGVWIRSVREQLGLTMEDVQRATSVNVGQISRFETGKFVFVTKNLQSVMTFLQKSTAPQGRHPHLLHRFAELLGRSPRHQAAALALVGALEVLE
jgi:transcriptional regulator with XRE-family HTH domain